MTYGIGALPHQFPAAPRLDPRTFTRLRTVRSDGSHPDTIPIPGGYAAFGDWSPDGERIAYLTRDSVMTARENGSDVTTLATRADNSHRLSHTIFSPDGTEVAYNDTLDTSDLPVDYTSLYRVSSAGGEPQVVASGGGDWYAPGWQPR